MSVRKATGLLFRDPTSFFAKSRTPVTEVFSLPAKLKGGRIEKFVNYWKGVKEDYSEAFKGEPRSTLPPAMTTAVAQQYSTCLQSNTLEVVCSMLDGCWAFLSIFIPHWRVLSQVPRGGATLLIFPLKDGCLAVKLGA